jgi:CheY-like chemotaxis protein
LTFYWVGERTSKYGQGMTAARVLLVDDNEDNLELLSVILRESYEVLSYACAQEALTALEAAKPDLLLLDIGMAPIDGMQCLKAIRAMPGYGSIPAVALTAYARDAEREAFLASGFQAVVTKPIIDHRALFATISALLTSVAAPSQNGSSGSAGDSGNDQFSTSHRALTGPTGERMLPLCGLGNPATPRLA